MGEFVVDKDTIVMCSEPKPDLTAEMAAKAIEELETELELATLFAVVWNKAWWIGDELYDCDVGTTEYKQAKEKTDLWFSLEGELKNKIFDILCAEGVEIPKTGVIVVLEPFMKRNGFRNGQGWWINAL